MSGHLGGYFRAQRLDKGLSLEELAQSIGYKNLRKGAHRIARFEDGEPVNEVLIVYLAEILDIDFPVIEKLLERDLRERDVSPDQMRTLQ